MRELKPEEHYMASLKRNLNQDIIPGTNKRKNFQQKTINVFLHWLF